MSPRIWVCKSVSLALLAALATHARAAVIPASIQNVSSQFIVGATDRAAAHCIDGSGLDTSNPPQHTSQPNGKMWLNEGDGSFSSGAADPHPNGDLAQITFSLNGLNTFGSFRVWNYNELNNFNDRSINALTVSTATNCSGPFTPLIDPANGTTAWTFAQAPGAEGYTGQLFTFAAPVQTAYVRFDILTNYDSGGTDHGFVGLSEIQFNTPVPEPSMAGLLGSAACVLLGRRRRAPISTV